jgi:hypothetical protein
MSGGVLILLAFLAVFARADTSISSVGDRQQQDEKIQQWMQAVDGILTKIQVGPLNPQFTPAFLAQRKRDQIIAAQSMSLRAYVANILVQSLAPEGIVHISPPPEYAPEVVEAIVTELKQHSFSVRWVASGTGRSFVVNIPRTAEK